MANEFTKFLQEFFHPFKTRRNHLAKQKLYEERLRHIEQANKKAEFPAKPEQYHAKIEPLIDFDIAAWRIEAYKDKIKEYEEMADFHIEIYKSRIKAYNDQVILYAKIIQLSNLRFPDIPTLKFR